MGKLTEDLYKVQKSDMKKAGSVFAAAFRQDPIWSAVFEGVPENQLIHFFESPALYTRRYGKLYAPTGALEGMAGWVRSRYADMTFARGLACGSVFSAMKTGMERLKKLPVIFRPLEEARKENMKGRDYIYLMILGISPENQGKGLGGKLLRAVIQDSEASGLPIYLETSTRGNVSMYEHFGFRQINEVMHPLIDLPQWCMIRTP